MPFCLLCVSCVYKFFSVLIAYLNRVVATGMHVLTNMDSGVAKENLHFCAKVSLVWRGPT